MRTRRRLVLSMSIPATLAFGGAALARTPPPAAAAVPPAAPDFVRDVQPILAASCVRCHGPAKQKGKLRLDTREGMLARAASTAPCVVPGDPAESPVYENLVERDPMHRMPKESDPLPAAEIDTIRRWIEAGAALAGGPRAWPPRRARCLGRPRPGPADRARLSFNRDVRPILAESCFACHGPDRTAREAGLRLDREEVAKAALALGSGADRGRRARRRAMLLARIHRPRRGDGACRSRRAGKPRLQRRAGRGPPPLDRGRRGVGAALGATSRPTRPPPPRRGTAAWPRSPVDAFVLARLEAEELSPSAEAARAELLRRVSLDLTGPAPDARGGAARSRPTRVPTPTSGRSTACSPRPATASGWPSFWLDLVRYADSVGYHSDNARADVALPRLGRVDAFNRNMPFDRFTAEQLAGDLLPERDPRAEGRLRLQPPAADHRGGRRAAEGVPRDLPRRPRAQRLDGLDGRDDGLRAVPRPQVRPVPRPATSTPSRRSSPT